MEIKLLPWLTILTCSQVKSQNPYKVTSSCDDNNFIVNIPHPDKNTANLLHLHAGNCDETNYGGEYFYDSDSNNFVIKIPIDNCDLTQ